MSKGLVTLVGGSGFLGQYAARAFVEAGWRVRVACRRVNLAGPVRLAGPPGWVDIVQANVKDRASLERAFEGADAVVNLVGLLYERGPQNFHNTMREGAGLIAEAAEVKGVKRIVQVSAIGAEPSSRSEYARTKAASEVAMRALRPDTVILRPSIVFGPEDQFFNRFAAMSTGFPFNVLPVMPSIGGGRTKFQPVYAGDVARAIVAAIVRGDTAGKTYELGGPQAFTLNEVYDYIGKTIDRPRFKLWMPFWFIQPAAYLVGTIWRFLPPLCWGWLGMPPITGDQVELLKRDNVPAPGAPGFADLGVTGLETVESIVPTYLWRFRPYGEFHQPKEA